MVLAIPRIASAEFTLNFNQNPNVVASGANTSCDGGGMNGGMMNNGGCTDNFSQELVDDNGTQYYHVILGDPGSDFALEYYVRSLGTGACWFGCGGGGGGMMGMSGPAPLTPSDGTGGLSGNNTDPLGSDSSFTGNGTTRPDRVYMRQINNSAEMTQEFLKDTEVRKPKITQTVNAADVTVNFAIDMSNSGYGSMNNAGDLTLTSVINDPDMPDPQAGFPDSGNFDIADFSASSYVTGGRYTYQNGSGNGGASGTYNYFDDSFDVYNVDWASYCDPNQNDHNCTFGGGGGGGGGMDGGGGGGGGGGGMM
jgi:hypothetical protein